jgi:hypothetical protein
MARLACNEIVRVGAAVEVEFMDRSAGGTVRGDYPTSPYEGAGDAVFEATVLRSEIRQSVWHVEVEFAGLKDTTGRPRREWTPASSVRPKPPSMPADFVSRLQGNQLIDRFGSSAQKWAPVLMDRLISPTRVQVRCSPSDRLREVRRGAKDAAAATLQTMEVDVAHIRPHWDCRGVTGDKNSLSWFAQNVRASPAHYSPQQPQPQPAGAPAKRGPGRPPGSTSKTTSGADGTRSPKRQRSSPQAFVAEPAPPPAQLAQEARDLAEAVRQSASPSVAAAQPHAAPQLAAVGTARASAAASDAPVSSAEVGALLERYGLAQYAERFDAEGYDDVSFLVGLSEKALQEVATDTEMKAGHSMKLITYIERDFASSRPAH